MSEINIKAHDGSGGFMAYVAEPAAEKAPALIVIQEIFGINANMRRWCENMAAAGYLAVCPDLFWRQQPGVQLTDQSDAEWEQAMKFYQGFDLNKGVEDLAATLEAARHHPRCNGKVGCIGFCLGGRLAVLMATRTGIDAAVSYYGVALDQHVGEFAAIKKPLLVHIAGLDKYVPPPVRAALQAAFAQVPGAEVHVYENADHAFARINGQNYNRDAAETANGHTRDFLASALKH